MRHLYIHIPFCDSKCPYCSFNSFTGFDSSKKTAYMSAISKQLDFELERFQTKTSEIRSVYFGGGTPSTIEAVAFISIFKRLRPYLNDDCEITFEANPNSATQEWLDGIKSLGANRISIGTQSFNAQKLRLLGRTHSANDAKSAVARAKKAGFDNISIDLIYDTPFDSEEFLLEETKEALALDVTHISAYSLTLEEDSAFAGKNKMRAENLQAAMSLTAYLEANGFEHYEVSNFGKKRSRHNMAYWRGSDYAGVGCGAVGFLKNERYYPAKELSVYIDNPLACDVEKINEDELAFEKLFLGFRSKVGVAMAGLTKEQLQKSEILLLEKKVIINNKRLVCQDLFLADEIAIFLS